MEEERIFNLNVGILGHVDSGKTSLARALSSILSTAALDKDPQSQERGITIDLGFSALILPMPPELSTDYTHLRLTLVDCPGHASFVRTIVAGASIIDRMILVIDATKGVQTQTAECIVLGELMIRGTLLVAINKIDLVEEPKLEALEKKLRAILSRTKFGTNIQLVRVAASPKESPSIGVDELVRSLVASTTSLPERRVDETLFIAVDHCFQTSGQGTVMTGTILHGQLRQGETVEIASLGVSKKIKSIQSFHKPTTHAIKGDRVGIRITQFRADQLERGVLTHPGLIPMSTNALIEIHPIAHYKGAIKSKAKFHIMCGNEVVMGSLMLFSAHSSLVSGMFDGGVEYHYEQELEIAPEKAFFAVIEFETRVCAIPGQLLIGAKLDMDVNAKACRFAFHGSIQHLNMHLTLETLRIFTQKSRQGEIDRVTDPQHAILQGMFKRDTDLGKFQNLKVRIAETGAEGVIEGSFGSSGKCRLYFPGGDATKGTVVLEFKKMLFDASHRIYQ